MTDSLRQQIHDAARERGIDEESVEAVLAGLPDVPDSMLETLDAVLDYLAHCDKAVRD